MMKFIAMRARMDKMDAAQEINLDSRVILKTTPDMILRAVFAFCCPCDGNDCNLGCFPPIGFLQPAPSHGPEGALEAILPYESAYAPSLIWEIRVKKWYSLWGQVICDTKRSCSN